MGGDFEHVLGVRRGSCQALWGRCRTRACGCLPIHPVITLPGPLARRVDVVVCPVESTLLGVPGVGLSLPAFPLVSGDINLIKLLKILKPKVRGA